MQTAVVFLVIGLGAGALYAALAMGLVLVHRGTGTLNFAQGAIAMWGAYTFDEMRRSGDLVLPVGRLPVGGGPGIAVVAAVAAVAVTATISLVLYVVVFRPLRTAPPLAKVVASVGLMTVLQAAAALRFGTSPRAVERLLPGGSVRWGNAAFSRDVVYLAAITAGLGALLWAGSRFTRAGLALAAASEDELAAALHGFSPPRLAAGAWAVAGAVTGLVAVLAAPSTGLSATTSTLFVVPALAAALLGRLQSLPVAAAAGLAIGAAQSELTYLGSRPWWPDWARTGFVDLVPFVVIVVALAVLGDRLPTRGAPRPDPLPVVPPARPRPLPIAAAVGAAVVVLAATGGSYRFGLVTSMIGAILALSLVVVVGLVGQTSLAQAAFAGAAGFTLSKLTAGAGVPFPFSMLLAALASTALGVLVAIPALRIRGAQLAVVSLAGAVAIERFVFRNPSLSPTTGNPIADPELFGVDLGVRGGGEVTRLPFGLLVLAVLVLVALLVANVIRSDTGRAFLAVRSNERAAAAAGVNVAATKLAAFGLSAFIAGIGGCLLGYSRGQLSADSFGVFVGLSLLASAYLGGITSVPGAIVAGLFVPLGLGFVVLDRAIDIGRYYLLLSGLGVVTSAIANPDGVAGRVRAGRDARRRRRTPRAAPPPAAGREQPERPGGAVALPVPPAVGHAG